MSEADKADLGGRLAGEVRSNNTRANQIAESLRREADKVFSFLKSHSPETVHLKDYDDFWNIVGSYYLPHLSVKYIVDYLSKEELEKFLPVLEEARLYAEPVFREIENFVEKLAEATAVSTGYSKELLLCVLKDEWRNYFKTGAEPDRRALEARLKKSALVFDKGSWRVYADEEVVEAERIIFTHTPSDEMIGQIAYRGKTSGRVKIVWNPSESAASFKSGDILVTGMTRPEFLPLMKKAAAFVTDAGGILSHAAIVAREMKKPCIIGTKIATKVLKDGDVVEVDADKGVVKIIKRK